MTVTIVASIVCLLLGGTLSYVMFRYVLKSKYDSILKEAETEAEVIKKQAAGSEGKIPKQKAELGKKSLSETKKIQQTENKLKQREMVIAQRQDEFNVKKQSPK